MGAVMRGEPRHQKVRMSGRKPVWLLLSRFMPPATMTVRGMAEYAVFAVPDRMPMAVHVMWQPGLLGTAVREAEWDK